MWRWLIMIMEANYNEACLDAVAIQEAWLKMILGSTDERD